MFKLKMKSIPRFRFAVVMWGVSVVAFFVKITYSHTPKQNGANKNAKGNKTEVF